MAYNFANVELFCSKYMQEKFKRFAQVDYQKHHDLKVEYIKNGVIYPIEIDENRSYERESYGGVCYEDISFCELSCPKRFPGDSPISTSKWFIGANPKFESKGICYRNEEVFFAGVLKHSTGHFMIENFSLMWFFLNPQNKKKYKIVYLLQGEEKPNYDFVRIFYKGLGLDFDNFEEIKTPTRFKTVVVAEPAMELNGAYHPVLKDVFDKVKSSLPSAKYKKVYLSKKITHSWNGCHLGDSIASDLMQKNGFQIIYPETTPTEEFISILNGCEVFAAESGSNAHNAFLLNDGTKCVIFNRSPHFHPTQLMIDEMKNLKTYYVDTYAQSVPIDWSQGPFIFKFTEYLKSFLNKYEFEYDEYELIQKSYHLFWDFLSKWINTILSDSVYVNYPNLWCIDNQDIANLCEEFAPPSCPPKAEPSKRRNLSELFKQLITRRKI